MAKRYEFKPDKERSGIANKLVLTRQQKQKLLKWSLYTLALLLLSVVQDVLFSRVRLFGVTTELVPCGIFLICLAEGLETGSVFALVSSSLYLFSGSAAGEYSIVLITVIAVLVCYFRQSYLQKGFAASMLSATVAMLSYELTTFAVALFLGQTTFFRLSAFCLTGVFSIVFAPVLYPILKAISAIGGEAWKE